MKKNLLFEQMSWFFPHQESEFITICNDTTNTAFAKCQLHYFMPHKNVFTAEDIEKLINPPDEYKDYISIDQTNTHVMRDDIYFAIEIVLPINKIIDGKETTISHLLEMAADYISLLSERAGKRKNSPFPKGIDYTTNSLIIDIINNNKLLDFPVMTIMSEIEYDNSLSIKVTKLENDIDKSINVSDIENKNISIDKVFYEGAGQNGYEITCGLAPVGDFKEKLDFKKLLLALSKALNKLQN